MSYRQWTHLAVDCYRSKMDCSNCEAAESLDLKPIESGHICDYECRKALKLCHVPAAVKALLGDNCPMSPNLAQRVRNSWIPDLAAFWDNFKANPYPDLKEEEDDNEISTT